jgi:membrane protein implicated in regulation of membrane protease activity
VAKKKPSAAAVRRYMLFQIPGLIAAGVFLVFLSRVLHLPIWAPAALFLCWIAKDALLFPILWPSFEPAGSPEEEHSLVGEVGRVVDALTPRGRIRVRGEMWQAELQESHLSAERDREVIILRLKGLTLIVKPDDVPTSREGSP